MSQAQKQDSPEESTENLAILWGRMYQIENGEKILAQPFDPRKTPEEGLHREAKIRDQVDIDVDLLSEDPSYTNSKVLKISMNNSDKIRISVEDYIRASLSEIPTAPIRFGFRRGWFWFTGTLPRNKVFVSA